MKLSMWTICDYLTNEGFEIEPHISNGVPCIDLVRQSKECTYSSGYAELFRYGKNIIISNEMDRAVIKSSDMLEVSNCIAACFNFYCSWETDLYEAMIKGSSLQNLLDIAHKVFKRPMFIKNDSTRTFAITREYPDSIHPYWSRIVDSLDQGIPDYEVVRTVSLDSEYRTVFLEHYPSVRWSPLYKNRVLHANIYLNEKRVAEIVVLENGRQFNDGEVHVMNFFVEMMERYIASNSNIFQSGLDVAVYLANLAENGPLEDEQISALSHYIGLEPEDEYCVLVAANIGLSDSPILNALREKLETQLKDAIIIPYKDQIVILRGMKGRTYDEIITDYKQHIPREGFNWALSYEFSGIEKMPDYYAQACDILEKAVFRKDNYVTMYEMAPKLITRLYCENPDTKSLIHPDLIRLENVDIKENTQYCETMFYFLLCGGNYTDASRVMALHRNTLIYRMNKIRDIVRSNIDNVENRKLLLYSYLFMGKDYQPL